MRTLQLSPECAAQPSAALFSPRGGRRDTVTHPLQFQLVTLFRLAVILKVQFTQFKKSYCLTQWYPATQRALGSFQVWRLSAVAYVQRRWMQFFCLYSAEKWQRGAVLFSNNEPHAGTLSPVRFYWQKPRHRLLSFNPVKATCSWADACLWDLIIGIKKHPWMTI